jgi:signal peptidase I
MGDNRDHSQDSRSDLGAVPAEFIVGRAVTVLFTLHRCRREAGLSCPTGRVWRGL